MERAPIVLIAACCACSKELGERLTLWPKSDADRVNTYRYGIKSVVSHGYCPTCFDKLEKELKDQGF